MLDEKWLIIRCDVYISFRHRRIRSKLLGIVLLPSMVFVILYLKNEIDHPILSKSNGYSNGNIPPIVTVKSNNGSAEMQGAEGILRTSISKSREKHSQPFDAEQNHIKNLAHGNRVIRILTWTPVLTNSSKWFNQNAGEAYCNTNIQCAYSKDRSLYNVSDVILFHARLAIDNDTFPSYRLLHQHWMTYLHETPDRIRSVITPYSGWFNWTIAYTMNADIIRPYGICLPNQEKMAKNPSSVTKEIRRIYGKETGSLPWRTGKKTYHDNVINYAKDKTGLVLWAVSNCRPPSRRDRYVEELKRHIKVNIIGKCGDDVCSKGGEQCFSELCKSHTFYLSFENSLCVDYITEKTFSRMEKGIVPIVLGAADYKKFLPKHSYIDIKDFASPKALATYLHKLDNDDDLYNEYFAWRQDYTCHAGIPKVDLLCSICQFMNENIHKVNIIEDVNRFWNKEMCLSSKEYYGRRINI